MEHSAEVETINMDNHNLYRLHLSEKEMKSTPLICHVILNLTTYYPFNHDLDDVSTNSADVEYQTLSTPLGHIIWAYGDDQEIVRKELRDQFSYIGIEGQDHQELFFKALELEVSKILTDDNNEGYLRSYLHGKTRKVLKLHVNFGQIHDGYYDDDSECRFIPAARSAIDGLEKVEIGALDVETRKENCSICCEGLEMEEEAMKMPCQHVFHNSCIVRWLESSHFCPLCRFEMPMDDMSD